MNTPFVVTPIFRRLFLALAFCLPLSLRAAPTIGTQPGNQVATVGDPAAFTVVADGTTPLYFQWTKNGIDIPGATNSVDTFVSTFTIDPVGNGDAAGYSVVITNSTGSITSRVALLTVVEPDITASLPLNLPVNTCTNITLSVATLGTDTNLTYQWYFGDEMMPVGVNSSNLVISGVEFANAGLYKVYVTNDNNSSDFASGTLSVTDPPPVVLTTNITVYLDATGDATITAAQVDNGSYDNCSITNMSLSQSNFYCTDVGPNLVTLSVTDNSNQTSQATATVTVLDTNPPVANFTSISVQLDNTGNYSLTPTDMANIGARSSDACGIASYSVTPSTFGYCNQGPNTVTLTVTDAYGNHSSVNGMITVLGPVGPPTNVVVDTNYTGSCAAVTFPFTNGTPGTYYIGYNAFSSIQAGLNAAASNGVVNVAPETFNEQPLISQPVTLTSIGGTNAANTTIVLPILSPQQYGGIYINSSNVGVEGFTIIGYDAPSTNTGPTDGQASVNIYIDEFGVGLTNIEIANNVIEVGAINPSPDFATGSDGFGIETVMPSFLGGPYSPGTSPAGALDQNLNFHNNIFEPVDVPLAYDTPGNAFFINPAGNFTFVSNTINGDLAQSTTSATNSLIAYNTVIGAATNDSSGAFATFGFPDPNFYGQGIFLDNVISNTTSGIAIYDSEHVTIENNLLNGDGVGISVQDSGFDAPVYPAGTTVHIVDNSLANDAVGVTNSSVNSTPIAVSNWWGDISGPSNPVSNPYGIGSSVSSNITFIPWLNNGTNSTTNGFAPTVPAVAYPPAQLAFATEPVGADLGSPLTVQPVVQIEDTYGNLTPWANPLVTNTLGNDPDPNAKAAGTNPEQAVNGVATFTDLSVTDSGGTNLVLVASAAYLPPATSTQFNITNPAPTISSINPFFARAGGGVFTITVSGTGFVGDSVVYWNGMALVTTYVSSTELTATVPAGDIAATNTAEVTVGSPGPGGGGTGELAFQVDVATPPVVYVDNRYTGLATNTLVDWPYDTNTGPHIIGYDAFAKIQDGVTNVAADGTVNVAAGTYTEEVTINQPLSLLGPNAANNPNTSVRVSEAVILPDTNNPDIYSNPNIYGNGGVTMVYIGSVNGVTIKGFTIDGYNPALTGAFSSGTNYFNAATGIGGEAGSSSVRIENNIVKDDAFAGIDLESDGEYNPATTNNFVKCNLIENMDYNQEGYGIGITLYNDYYAEVTDNCLTNVCIGISPQNYYLPNPGDQRNQTIANNKISASIFGIWLSLIYNEQTPNSTFAISNNTVSFMPTNGSVLYGPLEWDGIKVTFIQNAVNLSLASNTIVGCASNVGYNVVGYNIASIPTTGDVSIIGGSVSNANYGVWINDYDGWPQPGGDGPTKANVSGVAISDASTAGVYVQDDPRASANGVLVQATVDGNTVITGSALGVWVQGTNAGASVSNDSASITGNSVGVSVDTGVALLQGNDLRGNSLAGIIATNGAVVDAGNCTGNNVTGLGISTGGNNLSGYGSNAAPWAIINANPLGSPIVLADHDNFGAVLGDNIAAAFSGPVDYSQSPAVIGSPTNVMVVCVSDVPAPATDLASFIALGGYYSGGSGTVGSSDSPTYPYFAGSGPVLRTYTITDGCGLVSTAAVQTITVSDTIPPVFTLVPTNIIVPVDHGQTYASDVTWIVTAMDNCAVLSVVSTPTNGSTFPVGITTVTVVATDTSSNQTVTNFTVEVVGLPQITQQPMSRTNNAGTTATFSVVATSPTPLTYLWKKNGIGLSDGGNISGSTNSTLTITTVSNLDVASYSVCVSNLAGAVLSSNATLTVIDPPVIATQPVSVTNNATTTATFSVVVNGTSPFGYQWFKDGTNQLVDGGNISGSLSNILTLTNVLAADRGLYSVVVTNPAGSVISSNAVLGVVDPWIPTQPVNATEPLGGTVTFSVGALGTEPLTYQWQQGVVGIPNATNSSYTIAVIRDSDVGTYNVIVSGVGGSVTSSNATLTVTHPPVFVTEPQSQTVVQGQPASFNVTMNGTTPFTYQWQFNSVSIPGANGHILTLNNVTTNNAGNYSVLVTNMDGFAVSSNAVLTVIVPPSFVTQPVSITNNAGTTATFSVVADGTSLAYQWFKNGTNTLTDGTNVSGSGTAMLTLSNVLGGDAGVYSVEISNLGGSLMSSNATLTVIDPVITNEPASVSVVLGSPASFSVGVAGTSPTYQWRKGGTAIGNATNSTYSLASVVDTNGGSYDVVVTTIYGSVTSTPPAVLTVFDPALVTIGPVSITRDAGATATFTVTATGTAPLGYQWFQNSSPLSDGGNIAGSLTATLTISMVSDSDATSYYVVVTNAYGTNISGSATLTVIDPPVITNQPASITNNAGTTATFTVGVSGTQPLSYQWFKNVTNLLTDTGNVSGATSNVLTLSDVFGADRGVYSVIVTNAAGMATSSNATLTVIDPVITVEPTNITAIDGSTITFTVTAVGTANLNYQWREDDVDLEDGFGITGSGTATLTISDVADSDAGNYSVVITNSQGVATSVEAVLTTVPPLIVFQPTNAYVLVGQPFSFSVEVNGVEPFSYQWVHNNININNATSRIYSSAAAALSDAGTYYVIVTNPDGSETSATATLQVFSNAVPVLIFQSYSHGQASILLQGVPTFTYQLQASTNLSTTNWVPVETNTSPFIFTDPNTYPQRFYRGVYLP